MDAVDEEDIDTSAKARETKFRRKNENDVIQGGSSARRMHLTFFAIPDADSRRDGYYMSLARAALPQNAARKLVQLIVPNKVDGFRAKNRGKTFAGRHVARKTHGDVQPQPNE